MAGQFKGKRLCEAAPMFDEPRPILRSMPSGHLLLLEPGGYMQKSPLPMGDGHSERSQFFEAEKPRQWTQTDQDETDAETKRRIMKDLVNSWMDRLQLISVITTFFAATEAQLLGFATPDVGEHTSLIQHAATTILAGALVVHLFAAILSFLAAFFLIRYRLKEAKRAEDVIESGPPQPTPHTSPFATPPQPPAKLQTQSTNAPAGIWSTSPHLEQVGPFSRSKPPTSLLEHCHSLCMWLAAVGFVLALAGVLCYSWSRLPRSASILSSVCMGVCIVLGIGAVFIQF
ncbi:uncharacterized protein FIBRA_08729 [Fibroporia radiculosa]|uniref:Transmembrane protein n=1 Tax=Fibroporia radiculosa TaxID=599839 RepID=J4H5B8_9APHY|nr:uncharacterized protein FIBRA_08729 [Fibroporia radiculosa]CCM06464.1 predicted protein [Fibroporia radiculosa]